MKNEANATTTQKETAVGNKKGLLYIVGCFAYCLALVASYHCMTNALEAPSLRKLQQTEVSSPEFHFRTKLRESQSLQMKQFKQQPIDSSETLLVAKPVPIVSPTTTTAIMKNYLTALAGTATFVHFLRFSQVIPSMNPQQSNSVTMKAVPLHPSSDSVLEQYTGYKPAPAEAYLLNHTRELGLATPPPALVKTCHIWNDANSTPYHSQLHEFLRELEAYYNKVKTFQSPIPDLRKNLTENNHQICDLVKLHPDGLPGMFNQSQQLSYTAAGWTEPLMVPMRHPRFCTVGRQYLIPVDYLLHDFHTMCLKLKPTSRTVFVDMGASLSFHGKDASPALKVMDLYRRFGFKFDHIYAYEMKQQTPEKVFKRVPQEYEAAYHWINIGVASEPDSRQNPLKMLMESYNEDDLVIVKLDIDTPFLELPLAKQVSTDPRLAKLIDHFYFEHHFNQEELSPYWGHGKKNWAKESAAEPLELFTAIRKQGIAAHYWV